MFPCACIKGEEGSKGDGRESLQEEVGTAQHQHPIWFVLTLALCVTIVLQCCMYPDSLCPF